MFIGFPHQRLDHHRHGLRGNFGKPSCENFVNIRRARQTAFSLHIASLVGDPFHVGVLIVHGLRGDGDGADGGGAVFMQVY